MNFGLDVNGVDSVLDNKEAALSQGIRVLCREVLQWETSASMSSTQTAAETVMRAFMLVYEYVQTLRRQRPGRGYGHGHGISEVISGVIHEHFTENVEPVIWASLHDSKSSFLTVYEEQWRQFVVGVAHLRTIFLPGDASWAELNPSNTSQPYGHSAGSRSVELIAMDLWSTRILHHAESTNYSTQGIAECSPLSVISRLTREVNDLLDRHRNLMEEYNEYCSSHAGPERCDEEGEGAAQANIQELEKISATVQMLRDDLTMLPGVHTVHLFLEEYVRRMKCWHDAKCKSFSGKEIKEYVRVALRYLAQEQRRAELCFQSNQEATRELLGVMLDHIPLSVSRETLYTLMDAVGEGRGCVEELKGLFELFSFVDNVGGLSVRAAFSAYATKQIGDVVDSSLSLLTPAAVSAAEASVTGLMKFEEQCDGLLHALVSTLRHLERIVTDAFFEMPEMQHGIEEGLEKGALAWRKADLTVLVERLAIMVHLLIRRGGDPVAVMPNNNNNNNKNARNMNDNEEEEGGAAAAALPKQSLTVNDVIRLFYTLHVVGDADQRFLEEHQRLMSSRLLLFFNENAEGPHDNFYDASLRRRQCEVERDLLEKFSFISSNSSVFRSQRMLAEVFSPSRLVVESHSTPTQINSGVAPHQPLPTLRVTSRLVSGGIWKCAPCGAEALENCPLLRQETQKSLERFRHFYQGRHIELCGAYSTGIARVRLPPASGIESENNNNNNKTGANQLKGTRNTTDGRPAPRLVRSAGSRGTKKQCVERSGASSGATGRKFARLQLSFIQLCIVLCFNKKQSWTTKELRQAVKPGELHADFQAGLSALREKGILQLDAKKDLITVGDLSTLEKYAVDCDVPQEGEGEGEGDSSSPMICLIPEVMSQRRDVEEGEGAMAEGGAPAEAPAKHCEEETLITGVVQLLKRNGPLSIADIIAEIKAMQRRSARPSIVESSAVKHVLEKLLERGHVQRDPESAVFQFVV